MEKIIAISDAKVMRSAAGYYVGRDCEVYYDDLGFSITEPYCRESGYFATADEADGYLKGGNF